MQVREEAEQMTCPRCSYDIPVRLMAQALAALRKAARINPNPKKLRACKRCGAELGAREMRKHKCK